MSPVPTVLTSASAMLCPALPMETTSVRENDPSGIDIASQAQVAAIVEHLF